MEASLFTNTYFLEVNDFIGVDISLALPLNSATHHLRGGNSFIEARSNPGLQRSLQSQDSILSQLVVL